MRIGFDGSCLSNRRGFGRFSRLLLDALARHQGKHELVVVLDRPSSDRVTIPESCDRVLVDVAEAPSTAASAEGRRRFGDMLAMGFAAARSGLDLMYFPATYTFFPVWNVPRLVVTMHDTLALAHSPLVFPTGKGRLAWQLKEQAAVRLADLIVTVSETSRRDLQAWFGLPPNRLRVISEGPAPIFQPLEDVAEAKVDADSVLRRYAIPAGARYLLYVGGLSPHKNLPRLIAAFAQIRDPGVRLVIVGDFGDVFHTHVAEIQSAVAAAGLTDRVLLPGFVPDADLVFLYNRAYALVQPSLMEGFGLPAVEAMVCGTPVISSNAGSLPEVIGEAGLFFDPTDVASMTARMNELLGDGWLRDELARKAIDRAKLFTWDRAARSLLHYFEEFDRNPPRGLGQTPHARVGSAQRTVSRGL